MKGRIEGAVHIPDDVGDDPESIATYLELHRIISAAGEKKFKEVTSEKTMTADELKEMVRKRNE